MARTIETITEQITREERTFRVERETPISGDYHLTIHREIVTRANGVVIATTPRTFAFSESAAKAMTRPAFAAYLAAVKAAKSGAEIIAAEAALYDALVAEGDAERAAAQAASTKDQP